MSMRDQSENTLHPARAAINDCWNSIGIYGDSSCPQLQTYIHCRNCPVYAAAAMDLLDGDLPPDYLAYWTAHVANEKLLVDVDVLSIVIFRLGDERLALRTSVFEEISGLRTMHTLPHRRGGVVLGLANVRGELLVCISLQHLLGLESAASKGKRQHALDERLLVVQHEGIRVACPVDEVYGVQRFRQSDLMEIPTTLIKAAAAYTKAVLTWQDRPVGLLAEAMLFSAINRSLASTTSI
jgi:chemotaxis-related protein WspD